MNITLEMVDQVIERTGCTYKEAKEALIEAQGDVLEAIVIIESKAQGAKEKKANPAMDFGNDLIEGLKEAIKKGNVTRVLLDKDNKVVMDIPVNAGIVGAVFFTPAIVVAILTALATGHALKIVKDNGEIIDLKDLTEDTINTVKEKATDIKDKFKHKENQTTEDIKEEVKEQEDTKEE
jgi:gas vesicle protein